MSNITFSPDAWAAYLATPSNSPQANPGQPLDPGKFFLQTAGVSSTTPGIAQASVQNAANGGADANGTIPATQSDVVTDPRFSLGGPIRLQLHADGTGLGAGLRNWDPLANPSTTTQSGKPAPANPAVNDPDDPNSAVNLRKRATDLLMAAQAKDEAANNAPMPQRTTPKMNPLQTAIALAAAGLLNSKSPYSAEGNQAWNAMTQTRQSLADQQYQNEVDQHMAMLQAGDRAYKMAQDRANPLYEQANQADADEAAKQRADDLKKSQETLQGLQFTHDEHMEEVRQNGETAQQKNAFIFGQMSKLLDAAALDPQLAPMAFHIVGKERGYTGQDLKDFEDMGAKMNSQQRQMILQNHLLEEQGNIAQIQSDFAKPMAQLAEAQGQANLKGTQIANQNAPQANADQHARTVSDIAAQQAATRIAKNQFNLNAYQWSTQKQAYADATKNGDPQAMRKAAAGFYMESMKDLHNQADQVRAAKAAALQPLYDTRNKLKGPQGIANQGAYDQATTAIGDSAAPYDKKIADIQSQWGQASDEYKKLVGLARISKPTGATAPAAKPQARNTAATRQSSLLGQDLFANFQPQDGLEQHAIGVARQLLAEHGATPENVAQIQANLANVLANYRSGNATSV